LFDRLQLQAGADGSSSILTTELMGERSPLLNLSITLLMLAWALLESCIFPFLTASLKLIVQEAAAS